MRKAVHIICILLIVACSAHFQDYQPIKVPKFDQKSLVPKGNYMDLVKVLKKAGASNAVVGHGICASGAVVDVVMADYLKHLYIFVDNRFLAKAKIPYDPGKAPVHPTVKVVRAGDRSAVVLVADVMRIKGKQAGLLVIFDEEGVKSSVPLPVGDLIKKHGAMRDPFIGGTDMESGILLTARNRDGNAWTKIYVLKLEGKKIVVDSVSYAEGASCACFNDWIDGKDGRELFGEIVE